MPPRPFILHAKAAQTEEIGRALAMLEDCRERTQQILAEMPESLLDWRPDEHHHTIGSLLYHIAAIEISWLAVDVMESNAPDYIWDWFPHEVRTPDGKLTLVTGESNDHHRQRLDKVRELLLATYKIMPESDFFRARTITEDDSSYEVTPSWVLHHLCQHEAEHRFEISALLATNERQNPSR